MMRSFESMRQRSPLANETLRFGGSQKIWLSAACLLLWTAGVQAQEAVRPPRLIFMPEMNVRSELELPPDGQVQAEITVGLDGRANLDLCQAEHDVCAVVAEALLLARFEPAQRAGAPVAARVRIELRIPQPPDAASLRRRPSAASAQSGTSPAAAEAATTPPATETSPPRASETQPLAAEPPTSYAARGRVHPTPPGARRLELAEMRDLPGAFGDPFRAVDALPGVVPVLSGLPYFFIRGSPPAGSLYIYDSIPLPALYHLAVGPAAIHPRMVGPITLYSGVAPARYGRLTGGAIVGAGPERPDGRTHAETELRLLDVSGYVQADALGGTLTAAARYGYPALLLSIFSPQVSLAYWDYQLRYMAALTASTRLELVGLGSFDSLSVTGNPAAAVAITYHRVEPRLVHRVGRGEFGAALLFGWEESALGSQFQLKATRVGPRVWFEQALGERSHLRLSADMQGISGNFSSTMNNTELSRETSSVGLVGNVQARSLWGVQLELGLRPWAALELQLGGRADAWLQSGGAQAVVDPRARLILHAADTLSVHVAAGVVHQPAVFYVPLPGIADLANDRGLQAALQSELGVSWDTPLQLRAELQLFAHRYENLVFLDTLLLRDALDTICSDRNLLQVANCQGVSIPKRLNGLSYGAEVFLRRPITERLSGFLSYTFALSTVDKVAGQPYTPSWDVRHLGNLVLQWRVFSGFSGGLRWLLRSGKVNGDFLLDDTRHLSRAEQRLPGFTRLDLEVSYAWRPTWGRMRVALEWFNVTMSREPLDVSCSGLPRTCQIEYLPAIFFPNLSVRGEH